MTNLEQLRFHLGADWTITLDSDGWLDVAHTSGPRFLVHARRVNFWIAPTGVRWEVFRAENVARRCVVDHDEAGLEGLAAKLRELATL